MNYKLIRNFLLFLGIVISSLAQASEKKEETATSVAAVVAVHTHSSDQPTTERKEELAVLDTHSRATEKENPFPITPYTKHEGITYDIAPFQTQKIKGGEVVFELVTSIRGSQIVLIEDTVVDIMKRLLDPNPTITEGRKKDIGVIVDHVNRVVIGGQDGGYCPFNEPVRVIITKSNGIRLEDGHTTFAGIIRGLEELEKKKYMMQLADGTVLPLNVNSLTIPTIHVETSGERFTPALLAKLAREKKIYIGCNPMKYDTMDTQAFSGFVQDAYKILTTTYVYHLPFGIVEREALEKTVMAFSKEFQDASGQINVIKYHDSNKNNSGLLASWVRGPKLPPLGEFGLIHLLRDAGFQFAKGTEVTQGTSMTIRGILGLVPNLYEVFGTNLVIIHNGQGVVCHKKRLLTPEEYRATIYIDE